MHAEAAAWIERTVKSWQLATPVFVLDVGGRDVNGTPRYLFPDAEYVVIDMLPGPNVDMVVDAAEWSAPEIFDVVLSTETFEHAERWSEILTNMIAACKPDGHVLITAAAPPRDPHSAVDGHGLRPGEYYGNVEPDDLRVRMEAEGLRDVVVDVHPRGDVYAWGLR